jgi:hypothetical protein
LRQSEKIAFCSVSAAFLSLSKEILMKRYNGIGPHPRVVRMFLAEKGLALPFVVVASRFSAEASVPAAANAFRR